MTLEKFQEDYYVVRFHSKYVKCVDSSFVYVPGPGKATRWKNEQTAQMWADMQRQGKEYTQVCKMTIVGTVFDNGEW